MPFLTLAKVQPFFHFFVKKSQTAKHLAPCFTKNKKIDVNFANSKQYIPTLLPLDP